MNVQGKIWGKTAPIFFGNNVEIHRIEGKKGGFCSKHRHNAKYNMFFVECGRLEVTVFKDYGSEVLEDVTILGPQTSTTVAPGDWHMFRVLEDCVAYEIYWVELLTTDIERENVGGIALSQDLHSEDQIPPARH